MDPDKSRIQNHIILLFAFLCSYIHIDGQTVKPAKYIKIYQGMSLFPLIYSHPIIIPLIPY